MAVLQVERINPQQFAAVQVSMENAGQIEELRANAELHKRYVSENLRGTEFAAQGGQRIKFSRKDYPDQFAYPGDWILVTDATYNYFDPNVERELGWQLTATSEVFVYGISTGLAGTADDFAATFTEQGS